MSPTTNPWDGPFPVFSYSESQDQRRRRCARAHYYAVYAAHGGWSAKPMSTSWLAYRLKKATPLAAAVGTAVHAAATTCVRALLAGEKLPTFDVLRSKAAESLNTLWKHSRRRRSAFLRTPGRVPLFLESLYGDGPTRSQLHRAAQTLDRALFTLVQSTSIWEWVSGAHHGDVRLMDPFSSMQLTDAHGPITCYGAADLIVRPEPSGPWHIVDFKTGTSDGVVDQILTYAVIAKSALGLSYDQGCNGVIASLGEHPDQAIAAFAIDPADLDDTLERIHSAVGAARALQAAPTSNEPLPIESFAKTENPRNCGWCSFRGLCQPDVSPLIAQLTAATERAA